MGAAVGFVIFAAIMWLAWSRSKRRLQRDREILASGPHPERQIEPPDLATFAPPEGESTERADES